MTDEPKSVERWGRWNTGRYRLHLDAGGVLDFTGRVRTKSNATGIVNYEVESESVVMFPHFDDLRAIERIAP